MNNKIIIYNANILIAGKKGDEIIANGWIESENGIITNVKAVQSKSKPYFNMKDVKYIDAKGNTVIPGFIDNHFHLVETAKHAQRIDLSGAQSFDDIGAIIKSSVETGSTEPIICVGLDSKNLREKRYPDRGILDKFSTNISIIIYSSDLHTIMLNTYAVLYLKTPYSISGIEHDEMGVPTGIFSKKAAAMLDKRVTNLDSEENNLGLISELIPKLIECGLTTVAAMEGNNILSNSERDERQELIFKYKEGCDIDIASYYQTTDIEYVLGKNLKSIGGALYVDGTFGSHTAALSFDYADAGGNRGILFLKQKELNAFVEKCCAKGLQISLDAIGDAAIEMVLKAFESVSHIYNLKDFRHRIEHAELITSEQMERAATMGIVLCVTATYEGIWGFPGGMYSDRLGCNYGKSNRLYNLMQKGLIVCAGSDSPITDFNPLTGIYWAMNMPVKNNSIDLINALKMYTYNGAYALKAETHIGSICPGKRADIVILNKEIMSMPPKEINEVLVDFTIKNGEILHRRR